MQAIYNGHIIMSLYEGFSVIDGNGKIYPKTVEGLLALTEDLK